ncbi:TVP38/TMEM64 family protein [Cyclobacterium plantarum]|uniref:TVP38/TMEM64 family membrane protein n=1 Tax=Cyclobacterium plantarum TaxID=2716263 RepID=A0ABX0HFX4_9BACT|nr:TVP38/TMEM64 family protein [Cyclobacterium plantarum]NHE58925.1 TVP38/TMEM64 family protein [Cyclobacterium plantarum]
MSKNKTAIWPYVLSVLFIGSLIALYFLNSSVQDFFSEAWEVLRSNDEERISNWVNQFGFWGPFIIVLAMVLQMFMFVIPSFLLMVVTILAYGPWLGSGIILVAIFSASSIGYGIGVKFGTPVIDKILGQDTDKKISGFLADYGFWAVIVTRLSPFLSNDAISIIGGMLRMGYWKFIGATLLGIFPLTVLTAFLGENTERLKGGLVWVGAISLLGFIGYVWWDRKRQKSSSAQ